MFVLKKCALIFSMVILSYVGEGSGDYRSFFASWFIFLVLILIEYIENYNFKKIDNQVLAKYFYLTGIIIFGFLAFVSLLGSMGLILLENSVLQPNSSFLIMEGLFLLDSGNKLTIGVYVFTISSFVVIFTILELFAKPAQSFEEKHKLKQNSGREVS